MCDSAHRFIPRASHAIVGVLLRKLARRGTLLHRIGPTSGLPVKAAAGAAYAAGECGDELGDKRPACETAVTGSKAGCGRGERKKDDGQAPLRPAVLSRVLARRSLGFMATMLVEAVDSGKRSFSRR